MADPKNVKKIDIKKRKKALNDNIQAKRKFMRENKDMGNEARKELLLRTQMLAKKLKDLKG